VIEELFNRPILVFGCGNTLLGDDGFGPEVAACLLQQHNIPGNVAVFDVGTSIGDFLFDLLLSASRPSHVFIVDAVFREGREPGEIFELEIDEVPAGKSADFSLHQFPSVNLLRELKESARVDVRILAGRIKEIPEYVRPGLSEELGAAVPAACRWLLREIHGINGNGTSMFSSASESQPVT